MVRWEPGAPGRLRVAAMDLFEEHGYEQITVAQIAQRAGLTERTFFRYFADKREVLFFGAADLERSMVHAVTTAPPSSDAARLVSLALEALANSFPDDRRPSSRRRQAVLDSQPALRERELLKLASLKHALASALRGHGVERVRAVVAAESAIGVFSVAFTNWLAAGEDLSLAALQREALAALRAVVMWV